MPDAGQIRLRDSLAKRTDAGLLPSPHLRSVLLFCAAIFFYWTALYLYVPILPVYAQSLGASLSMVGVVIASYALPQLLLRIPIGVWSDALGRRKPFVAGGIVVTSVGALGLGLAPTPWFLGLARVVTGIGAATWVTFTVYFTNYYSREGTGRAIGIINFVQGAALVVATSSGGAVAEVWGFGHTFFGATLVGIVALVALLFAREPTMRQAEPASWRSFTRVAASPLLLMAASMGILLQFVTFSGVFGFIPVYAAKIGASSTDLGIITMLAMGSSTVAALAAAPMAERWGNRLTIVLGSALVGIALLTIPFIQRVYVLEAVQVAYGLGRGVLSTILMTLSIQAVAPQQRATAMGVYQAAYSVGMLAGPLVSGFLADSQGLATVFYLSASLCLVIAGIACLPILSRH